MHDPLDKRSLLVGRNGRMIFDLEVYPEHPEKDDGADYPGQEQGRC